jgi:hypothetical protein
MTQEVARMYPRRLVSVCLLALVVLSSVAAAPAAPQAQTRPIAGAAPNYFDNRGNAVVALQSYFNALNRREYARAYGYWESASAAGPFAAFQAGYADTQSVLVTTGAVSGDSGAGQRYYTVPVILQVGTTGGPRTYAGCYVLHLSVPSIQTAPPFHPLGIASANVQLVGAGQNASTVQAQACAGLGGGSAVALDPLPGAPESGSAYYIDDRSGPLEVLQSMFNALNRREYARAYDYWENQTALGSFAAYQQGYAATQSIQWAWGAVQSEGGAGQLYWSVPVTLKVNTTGGSQTFVGCYRLQLSQPGIQAAPPYHPLGIISGNLAAVANNADTNPLMAGACSSPAPVPGGNPTQIVFAAGATSASLTGAVAGGGAQDYRIRVGAQQLMLVELSAGANTYLEIIGRTDGRALLLASAKAANWQGTVPAGQEYLVRVISKGVGTSYNLLVTIPRRITFARGAISASTPGTVVAGGINSYVLRALSGQTMTVSLPAPNTGLALEIYGLSDGQPLLRASMMQTTWTGKLPATQDYIIKVVNTGARASFTLATTVK